MNQTGLLRLSGALLGGGSGNRQFTEYFTCCVPGNGMC